LACFGLLVVDFVTPRGLSDEETKSNEEEHKATAYLKLTLT
jgi:hypothetical protein